MKLKLISIIGFLLFINVVSAQSDNCATATFITLNSAGSACVTGTTVNATSTNTLYGACNINPVNEVWYTFVTSGATNNFVITPSGITNPQIVIYSGGCAVQLETCNAGTGTGALNTNWGFPIGTQVWVGVMSNGGNEGGFQLCVNSTAPPPTGGNTCATAIALCDKNATTQVDMTTITPSGIQPSCFVSGVQNDVYFTFTVTQTGTLEFQVLPTGIGASMVELDWALYNITALGGCPTSASPTVACNYNFDNSSGNPAGMGPSSCTTCPTSAFGTLPCEEFCTPVTVTAGNTYLIIMDYFTGGGTGTMDFSFLPGMTAQIAPTANFTVTPTAPVCGSNLTSTITNTSIGGIPTWDFGDGSPTVTTNTPAPHNYSTPGTYAITATIGGTCPSTHTEFVQLFGPLATNVTPVTETCAGDCDGSISLATTGGSGNYTYSWTPGGQTTPVITGLCANNYNVTITDAVCGNLVQNVVLPSGPLCQNCFITNFFANIGSCQPNNTYMVNGTIDFTTNITTGTLTITVNDGINSYDTILSPPFVSPSNWSISGIPSNGNAITISGVFSADPTCTISLTSTAPAACACAAQIGNFNTTLTGNGTTNFKLCFGDQIDITAAGGFIPPDEALNPPIAPPNTYDPGIGYYVYSCPPTVFPPNPLVVGSVIQDPCLIGIAGFGNSFSDINFLGGPSFAGAFTNNTIYYVPITLYDTIDGAPGSGDDIILSYVNTSQFCYAMGAPIAVQYLPQVVSSNPTPNCLDSSFTITISGGLPQLDGSQFTASNLLPANASFVNTTTNNGGTIKIDGLLNGDMYSFDVADSNGCPITITGGPFVGLPNANAGVDNFSCTLSYTLAAIPSVGIGSWSGPAGVVFAPVNSPTATVTVLAAGTYNFTWTETNTAACVTSDVVIVTFSNLSATYALVSETCGNADGQITITASNGATPYQYSIDGGATFQASNMFTNLAANNYSVVVKDALGCQITSNQIVNSISGVSITSITPANASCNGVCDGTITVVASSPGGGLQYSLDGVTFQASNVFNALCAGNYTITVKDANNCTITGNTVINEPTPVTITANNVTICSGQNVIITATAQNGNGGPYTYNWDNGAFIGQNYNVTPVVSNNYAVFATDVNGCTSPTINVSVTVLLPLSVVATPADTSICLGQSVTIFATPFFGNGGPYTYLWSNGSTDSVQVVTPTTTTVYTVTLNDGCSTPTQGTVTIRVNPLPQVSFIANILESCLIPMDTFTFFNTTDTTGGMVGSTLWNFGDGSTSGGDTVTHLYNASGTYDVTLTVTSTIAAGGCTNALTKPNYITIHPNPVADFFMDKNPGTMLNPEIEFFDQSYFNITNWSWNFGGLDSSIMQNPIYTFPEDTGHYPILLIVTDINNCKDTTVKILEIKGDFGIYVPNAFTPDGDNINEGFAPNGFGINDVNYNFFVFDRWGEIIFESHTKFEPWDGTYKGSPVKNDVYVWKLDVEDINKKRHSLTGRVTLVR